MRVYIYKGIGEALHVLVEPSLGRGLPPQLLKDVTKQDIRERVEPVVRHLKRQPSPVLPSVPTG